MPMAAHVQEHSHGSSCRAASAKPALRTCTQVTRVCIHTSQTNAEAHNPLLVMGPGWDIQRQKG